MNGAQERLARALYARHAAAVCPHALAAVSGDRERARGTVQQTAALLQVTPQAVKSPVPYGLHRLVLILEEQESAW